MFAQSWINHGAIGADCVARRRGTAVATIGARNKQLRRLGKFSRRVAGGRNNSFTGANRFAARRPTLLGHNC
jgi:hypothetical protein